MYFRLLTYLIRVSSQIRKIESDAGLGASCIPAGRFALFHTSQLILKLTGLNQLVQRFPADIEIGLILITRHDLTVRINDHIQKTGNTGHRPDGNISFFKVINKKFRVC